MPRISHSEVEQLAAGIQLLSDLWKLIQDSLQLIGQFMLMSGGLQIASI